MGVKGLLTYVKKHEKECVEFLDLCEVARQRNGIELLVDFYAFDHHLIRGMTDSLQRHFGNDYLCIYGGEYDHMSVYMAQFIAHLRAVGINLVFYIDGSKGSSPEQTKQKMNTWKQGHKNDLRKLDKILEICDNKRRPETLTPEDRKIPLNSDIQILDVLCQMNCPIFQCSSGEADFELANGLQTRPKAFAILSNDSDFCIFENCVFIHLDFFDMQRDLGLGSEHCLLPEKPVRLICGVVTQQTIMTSLAIPNFDELIEFSILVGNDFTGPILRERKIKQNLDIMDPNDLKEIGSWLRHYERVENHPYLRQEMDRHSGFRDSVQHSRQFYRLQLVQRKHYKNRMTEFLDEAVARGLFPPNFMGIHQNVYWHKSLVEDTSYGHPCCEWALAELRSFLYRMVLPRDENLVTEYGRSPYEDFAICGMVANSGNLLTVDRLKAHMIFPNLKLFHNIITHLEKGFDMQFFNRYGRRNGFTVYCLRYFLVLNRGKNLNVELPEFLDLVAMVMCQRKTEVRFYQGLPIRPNRRCLTIASWFLDIYRHAYYMIGKALQLAHEFPKPREVFCGSMWAAFYMSGTANFALECSRRISQGDVGRILDAKQRIINEKRHIIRHIVEGHFQFNTDTRFR